MYDMQLKEQLIEKKKHNLYVNAPYGIILVHNGNLTNTRARKGTFKVDKRHTNTSSDTEMLLNVLATELNSAIRKRYKSR